MTNHTHRYMNPDTAALVGGRWELRGATWVWCEKPPYLRGSERFTWENRGAPDRCANTTSGANRRINSTEPRSEG